MTTVSRRAWLAQVACAMAVVGVPSRLVAKDSDLDSILEWRSSPVGMTFVDAYGNRSGPYWIGDMIMFSDWAGGGFAGVVCSFKINPWKNRYGNEGDFIGFFDKGDYTKIQTRVSSSLRHATHGDLSEIGRAANLMPSAPKGYAHEARLRIVPRR